MSVKKYFGLTVAGVATLVAASAMAGGPDIAPPPVSYSGFYLEGDIGYGRSNWSDFTGGVFNPTGFAASPGAVTTNGSGFVWGGDLGYQFNQYFSVEVGAYDLPGAKGLISSGFPGVPVAASSGTLGSVKVSSWILYAAGKLAVPLFENFDMFGKVGIAWRWLNYSGAGLGASLAPPAFTALSGIFGDQHYATWLAGVGFQYWFTPEWSLNVQYLHVPGYNSGQEVAQQAPNVDLIVAGAGYKFAT